MTPPVCLIKNDKPLDDKTFCFLMQFVSPEKQKRILCQRVKQNADNMLVGAVLAGYMLTKEFKIPLSAQHIAYGPYGKPYLKNYPDVFFNISHSGQWVACAVSDKAIGIDVQEVTTFSHDVAAKVCNNVELSMIESANDPAAEFTRIWTRKEAYLKMLGYGIGSGMKPDLFNENIETVALEGGFLSVAAFI